MDQQEYQLSLQVLQKCLPQHHLETSVWSEEEENENNLGHCSLLFGALVVFHNFPMVFIDFSMVFINFSSSCFTSFPPSLPPSFLPALIIVFIRSINVCISF